MIKQEIINDVAQELNIKTKDAKPIVEEVFSTIKKALESGINIEISGFGKFVDESTGVAVTNECFTYEIWQLLGLDKANAMTVTPNSRIVADINQTISGDGITTSTVARN